MNPLTFAGAAVAPLWSDLDLEVRPGEFMAVLGPNGVGKSTLIGAALGTRRLTAGTVRATPKVGYIPQQRMFDPELPMRVRDLVGLAAAHGIIRRRPSRARIDAALADVGAEGIADRRVGTLSGGQQQLVRQAQALVGDPELLLCDEPLLSLDPAAQRAAVDRLDRRRREHGTAVVFVTHGINPILGHCDRVLYITPHGHRVGPVEEIMTSETLSDLYRTDITVATVGGKLVVV
ncbi:metal ABC transporter ATP-binding protein [Corynebacterium hansenii]|uniref:Metal ABC transporter ATP-binding protein n=1 Tax=Corynebacterium hansenii TaxID=394964 RepID=A0ABV7ZPH2_9CORY|nr:metal ABC transporter ATP-binding protein [Corynebacterium hansenii]WJZ01012.1 putative ABC transporter ATP-binding protein [Corynebacterium hansenii]